MESDKMGNKTQTRNAIEEGEKGRGTAAQGKCSNCSYRMKFSILNWHLGWITTPI